jgi:PEP-CTERM motif-containing protein
MPQVQRRRLRMGIVLPLGAIVVCLGMTDVARGFGGHLSPPAPAAPGPGPDQPGAPGDVPPDGGGPPPEGGPDIPPVLINPGPGDITPEPIITGDDGGGTTPPSEPGSPQSAPEPATLLMGLLGAGLLGGAGMWKRRRRPHAAERAA